MESEVKKCLSVEELIKQGTPKTQKSKLEVKYIPSTFSINSFNTTMNEEEVTFQILKMKNSIFLWIGKSQKANLYDLALSLPDQITEEIISSKVLGSVLDTASTNLANKLSKKLNKPVYVSCNVVLDTLSLPYIEKCVCDALKSKGELF